MRPPRIGAIEAGGTKIVCGIGRSPEELLAEANQRVVPTDADPEAAWRAVRAFFEAVPPPDAIGVGSFGPLDLATGAIAGTPKPGWQGFSWPARCARLTSGPVALDSDVDAAALAELRRGAARGSRVAVYVTVGTGVGGGVVIDGTLLRGRRHPEMGHMLLARRPADTFAGSCRHHGACLEGLASGEAMRQRWGAPAETLPPAHPAWPLEADYLGLGLANLAVVLAPDRIVLGGGVGRHAGLLEQVRARLAVHLGGYLDMGDDPGASLEELVVAPGLGDRSGLVGAFELAVDLLEAKR